MRIKPRQFYSRRSHHRHICRTSSINMKQPPNSPSFTFPPTFALLLSIRTVESAPPSVDKSSPTIIRQTLKNSTKSESSQLNPISLLHFPIQNEVLHRPRCCRTLGRDLCVCQHWASLPERRSRCMPVRCTAYRKSYYLHSSVYLTAYM